jgi:hypothetical protein
LGCAAAYLAGHLDAMSRWFSRGICPALETSPEAAKHRDGQHPMLGA